MLVEGRDYKKIKHPIYKYEMIKPYCVTTDIMTFTIFKSYFSLNQYGLLTARIGYRWNGVSCSPDFKCLFDGALPHDIIYQLLQEGHFKDCFGFDFDDVRLKGDDLLYRLWLKNKAPKFVACIGYKLVRVFGKKFAKELKNV